jgi:hypothetical protein
MTSNLVSSGSWMFAVAACDAARKCETLKQQLLQGKPARVGRCGSASTISNISNKLICESALL